MIDFKTKLEAVISDHKHKIYSYTVQLETKYKKWRTGDITEQDIRSFAKRETLEEKKQRAEITKECISTIVGEVMGRYTEPIRNNNIKINLESENEEIINSIQESANLFYNYNSLEEWWSNKYKELIFTDPNAYILTDFYSLGDKKYKPYPIVVSSSQLLDYNYKNGELEYLIYKKNDEFYFYSQEVVAKASEKLNIGDEKIDDDGKYETGYRQIEIQGEDKRVFNIVFTESYPYKESFAIPVGYIPHPTIDYLYVSPLESVKSEITRLIDMCSEFDVNLVCHVFMQKLAYGERCTAQNCIDGYTSQGTECKVCKGTGLKQTHNSGLDTVNFVMPKDPAEIFDLTKLVAYVQVPVDTLKIQIEQIEKSVKMISLTLTGEDIFSRDELQQAATATEITASIQKQTNLFYPFALKYAQTFQFFYEKIADILGYSEAVEISYWLDKNMLRESLQTQLTNISTAQNSNVPAYIIDSMYDGVAYSMYLNAPEKLKEYEIYKRLDVLRSKSAQERIAILAGLKADSDIRIKCTYTLDIIAKCLEMNEDFLNLTIEKQNEIINIIILEYQDKLKSDPIIFAPEETE